LKEIGLGKLLNIPSMPIQRMLVGSLVEKFNAADRTFTIQGHVVSMSPWDVYCILGLVDKGEKIEISRKQADRKWFSVYKRRRQTPPPPPRRGGTLTLTDDIEDIGGYYKP